MLVGLTTSLECWRVLRRAGQHESRAGRGVLSHLAGVSLQYAFDHGYQIAQEVEPVDDLDGVGGLRRRSGERRILPREPRTPASPRAVVSAGSHSRIEFTRRSTIRVASLRLRRLATTHRTSLVACHRASSASSRVNAKRWC